MLTLTLHTNAATKKLLPAATLKKISVQIAKHIKFEKKPGEVTVAFVAPKVIQELNHDFRGKKKPTNVLSFPQFSGAELKKLKPKKNEIIYLGDVILCLTVIKQEAKNLKKTLNHHLIHLVVHGVLHLIGYDHMKDTDAKRMETLEKAILKGLGIKDPYILES